MRILQGCQLKGARLERAHLGGATGLTKKQLKEAHINKETVLPYYLKEQEGLTFGGLIVGKMKVS